MGDVRQQRTTCPRASSVVSERPGQWSANGRVLGLEGRDRVVPNDGGGRTTLVVWVAMGPSGGYGVVRMPGRDRGVILLGRWTIAHAYTRGMPSHTIVYAGEPGAFAEDAVLAAFGDAPRSAVGSFRAVFEAVTNGDAEAGVVPIENVINGTVRENYDLLVEFDLAIHGEVMVPVRLCLAALPGQRLEDIERVYSHIQALGQAEAFLRARPWQLLSTYNTAGAGKAIADSAERGAAAVLSPRAAGLFGLEILADDIGDLPDNRTRFLVLARRDRRPPELVQPPDRRRTTLVVAVRNEPGTLLAVLRVIAAHDLNMRKLESRPSRERAWEYVFWIDVDGDIADPSMAAALEEVRGVTTMTRVLGSYPSPDA